MSHQKFTSVALVFILHSLANAARNMHPPTTLHSRFVFNIPTHLQTNKLNRKRPPFLKAAPLGNSAKTKPNLSNTMSCFLFPPLVLAFLGSQAIQELQVYPVNRSTEDGLRST